MEANGGIPQPELAADPPLDEVAAAAVLRALEGAQLDDGLPGGLVSAWRSAGLEDAIDRTPVPGQAVSPRRIRGATRA